MGCRNARRPMTRITVPSHCAKQSLRHSVQHPNVPLVTTKEPSRGRGHFCSPPALSTFAESRSNSPHLGSTKVEATPPTFNLPVPGGSGAPLRSSSMLFGSAPRRGGSYSAEYKNQKKYRFMVRELP